MIKTSTRRKLKELETALNWLANGSFFRRLSRFPKLFAFFLFIFFSGSSVYQQRHSFPSPLLLSSLPVLLICLQWYKAYACPWVFQFFLCIHMVFLFMSSLFKWPNSDRIPLTAPLADQANESHEKKRKWSQKTTSWCLNKICQLVPKERYRQQLIQICTLETARTAPL